MEKIKQIADRIKGLRLLLDITPAQMATVCNVSEKEYNDYESGNVDFSFTFLYKCANKFGVDIAELISGETPRLFHYNIVRKNEGLPIERRAGFKYQHLGYLLKNRQAEPLRVLAKYSKTEQDKPITLSMHEGQEFDFIIKGKLKFQFKDHIEILNEGDSVYYDSSFSHGMIAAGEEDCEFLAIVIKKQEQK